MEQKQKRFVNTQIPMTQKSKKHNVLATSLMISLGVAFGLAGIFLLNQAGVTRAQQGGQSTTTGYYITGHDNIIQYVEKVNFYNDAQEIVATISANPTDGTLLLSGVDGIALAQKSWSDLGKTISASTVIGGKDNTVLATGGSILGGLNNKSKGWYSLIGGGKNNTIASDHTGQIILWGENNYNDGGIILGSNNENGIFEEVQKITVQNGMLCSEAPDITYNGITVRACNEGAIHVWDPGSLYPFDDLSVSCPVGYHVPSGDERTELLLRLNLNPCHQREWHWGLASHLVSDKFFLPFANDSATHYHSSTPGISKNSLITLRINNDDGYVCVTQYGVHGDDRPSINRRPVRCFSDKDTNPSLGWEVAIAGINNIIIGSNVSNIRPVEEQPDEIDTPPVTIGVSRGTDNNNIGYIRINDGTNAITMMDKNLWAKVAGTGAESYGHYFQWGNNYGFSRDQNTLLDHTQVDTEGYGPGNYYSRNKFVVNHIDFDQPDRRDHLRYDWSKNQNDNLRWGRSDLDSKNNRGRSEKDRQGPCPDGFHIPNAYEWNELLKMWYNINSEMGGRIGGELRTWEYGLSHISENMYEDEGVVSKFMNDFLLPYENWYYYNNVALVTGDETAYWSSTPYDNGYGIHAFGLLFNGLKEVWLKYASRISGASIRCFQNVQVPIEIAAQTATSNSFIRSDDRTVGNKFIPQVNRAFYINTQNGVGVNTNNPQTSLDSFGAIKLNASPVDGDECTPETAGRFMFREECLCWCNGDYRVSTSPSRLCAMKCTERLCGNGKLDPGEECDYHHSTRYGKGTCGKNCKLTPPCRSGEQRNACGDCPEEARMACPACGNGRCESGESPSNCPEDCCKNELKVDTATDLATWEQYEYVHASRTWAKSNLCPPITIDCHKARKGFDYCFDIIFSRLLTKKVVCGEKPANTVRNTVDSYVQEWNARSLKWLPEATVIPSYNKEASSTACRYKCADGYTRDAGAQICKAAGAETTGKNCTTLPVNAVWTSNGSTGTKTITQTKQSDWSWTPTNVSEYNASTILNACYFKCATNYTRNTSSCVAGTQSTSCAGTIPSNATSNATSTTWTQTWNGSSRTPSYSWTYNTTAGICTFKCNTNYTRNSSTNKCEMGTQTVNCTGLPSNAVWSSTNTNTKSITQTWNGSSRTPSATGTYNISTITTACYFKCNTNYTRNTSTNKCETGTQSASCAGTIPSNATSNATSTTWTQTRNGSSRTPSYSWTYNTTAGICTFKCNTNYTRSGSACVANTKTFTCAAKPTGTDRNTVSSYIQTWNGTAWNPADSATSYNVTASTTSCRYKCSTGYSWNWSSCITSGWGCFIAGTKVIMADGSEMPIESVKVGDKLLGSNGVTNTVLKLFRIPRSNRPLYAINGSSHFVTESHPFMSTKGWKAIDVAAAKRENPDLEITKLTIGDVLITLDGYMPIMSITEQINLMDKMVYNFETDGDNTYYADGFLVHNVGEQWKGIITEKIVDGGIDTWYPCDDPASRECTRCLEYSPWLCYHP